MGIVYLHFGCKIILLFLIIKASLIGSQQQNYSPITNRDDTSSVYVSSTQNIKAQDQIYVLYYQAYTQQV